ncbi:MAG TPA: hypothetical protein VMD59_23335 [Acidimicrobiales bacterium]|nr:hypothetical protein [Acidimicrobiales bacterium]
MLHARSFRRRHAYTAGATIGAAAAALLAAACLAPAPAGAAAGHIPSPATARTSPAAAGHIPSPAVRRSAPAAGSRAPGTAAPALPLMWAVVTARGSDAGARLVAVDPATGRPGSTIALPGGNDRDLIALAPDDEHAYVLVATPKGAQSVVPIDLATGRAGTAIALRGYGVDFLTSSMAFSPSGDVAYLADAGQGELVPVDVATGHVDPPIHIGNMAACGDVVSHLAVAPGGRTAYVASLGSFYAVDLADGKTSKPFRIPELDSVASYKPPLSLFGDPTIGLSPDGSTLWTLESGERADQLIPVATAGDRIGKAISVPVGARPTWPDRGEAPEPSWDGLDVVSATEALVIAYGAKPESIVPVDLATGRAGRPIAVSSYTQGTVCGDIVPLPVAVSAGATLALVGGTTSPSVRVVDLVTGRLGAPVPLAAGRGEIRALLSPTGYCDWVWPASWNALPSPS